MIASRREIWIIYPLWEGKILVIPGWYNTEVYLGGIYYENCYLQTSCNDIHRLMAPQCLFYSIHNISCMHLLHATLAIIFYLLATLCNITIGMQLVLFVSNNVLYGSPVHLVSSHNIVLSSYPMYLVFFSQITTGSILYAWLHLITICSLVLQCTLCSSMYS